MTSLLENVENPESKKKKNMSKKTKHSHKNWFFAFMEPFQFTEVQSMNQQLTEYEAESYGIMLLILCLNELFNFYFSIPVYQFLLFKQVQEYYQMSKHIKKANFIHCTLKYLNVG